MILIIDNKFNLTSNLDFAILNLVTSSNGNELKFATSTDNGIKFSPSRSVFMATNPQKLVAWCDNRKHGAAVPFLAAAANEVVVVTDLTPSKIEQIANDEGNLACQVRYDAGWTAEAAERAYWMAYHSVKARYLAAEEPQATETVNQPPMTDAEHDAALWGVWDTEMSLLEMTR